MCAVSAFNAPIKLTKVDFSLIVLISVYLVGLIMTFLLIAQVIRFDWLLRRIVQGKIPAQRLISAYEQATHWAIPLPASNASVVHGSSPIPRQRALCPLYLYTPPVAKSPIV